MTLGGGVHGRILEPLACARVRPSRVGDGAPLNGRSAW
ncbi:hypothetical protein A33M_3077 [Rhodovulum sp. PH10]|nr:hypothetical protein A33M_3077 [Rhodovulum sp. PH10]